MLKARPQGRSVLTSGGVSRSVLKCYSIVCSTTRSPDSLTGTQYEMPSM